MNIQKTSDYGQFLAAAFQRPINESNVQKIMESMRENGFDYSTPVVVKQVGKFLQIIRGQHRINAASRLGLPVYYIIKNELDDTSAIETQNTAWTPSDIVAAWADTGMQNYVYLREFSNQYKLPISLAAVLLNNNDSREAVRRDLVSGEFSITTGETALKVVEVLEAISEKWKFCKLIHFIGAIQSMFEMPNVNWKHFKKRMTASTVVPGKRTSILEYLNLFEEIYNYRLSPADRIPFAFNYQQNLAATKVRVVKLNNKKHLSSIAQKQKEKSDNKAAGKIMAGIKSVFIS
jgi:hypothetical protein